ncbi:MAG: hypothetical protein H7330_14695 [Hymenobacteraceae bacterium]|nr:hypothetical protein [Hymenobacteraceae bacterium]
MNNKVQLVIVPADLAKMTDLVTQLEAVVNKYVTPLSPEEREGGLKLGDRSVAFVAKVMEYAIQNPQLMPPGVDLDEVQRDYAVLTALAPLAKRLGALAYDLDSTTMLAGGDVMDAALRMYAQNQLNAGNNVPGAQAAVLEQQERFPGRRKAQQAQ